MPGGKGKTTGGKAGPKEAGGKPQKSHSAKAGLQVRDDVGVFWFCFFWTLSAVTHLVVVSDSTECTI